MAQIKSFTDLQQSKKLAEILPLATADMDYIPVVNTDNIDGEYSVIVNTWDNDHIIEEGWIPCWSLSALLSVLPSHFYDKTGRKELGIDKSDTYYNIFYENKNSYIEKRADNPVDACVDMIIKLKELNLL